MNISIVTVLRDGRHLTHWQEIEGDSIEAAADGPIAAHVNDRLRWHGENVSRFIVIAADLSWSISPAFDQHLLYGRPLQLVATEAR